MRITKGMIDAATANLNTIWMLATEQGNPNAACLKYHAHSANNSLRTLRVKYEALPEWYLNNQRYLNTLGWESY